MARDDRGRGGGFAPFTFREWFNRRVASSVGGTNVLLWPDTFNDYFHPETAIAAVEVLEHAGLRSTIPRRAFCCGRPLYDYGMLDTGEGVAGEILDALGPEIDAGVPVVGLEPSCVAVFRDEMREISSARRGRKAAGASDLHRSPSSSHARVDPRRFRNSTEGRSSTAIATTKRS